jgi:hypothetical protein
MTRVTKGAVFATAIAGLFLVGAAMFTTQESRHLAQLKTLR